MKWRGFCNVIQGTDLVYPQTKSGISSDLRNARLFAIVRKIRDDTSWNPESQARNEMEGFLLGCFFNSTERHVFCQTNFTEPQGKIKI